MNHTTPAEPAKPAEKPAEEAKPVEIAKPFNLTKQLDKPMESHTVKPEATPADKVLGGDKKDLSKKDKKAIKNAAKDLKKAKKKVDKATEDTKEAAEKMD